MNGYFQIVIKENETGIRLVRETDGGAPLGIQEITFYLNREKIKFNLKDLNNAIQSKEDVPYLKLMDETHLPVAESSLVKISVDRMEAQIRFYPPSEGGNPYRKEDIYSALAVEKVKAGIDDAMVEALFQKREYCKDYPIAHGKPVVEGRSAKIIYHFETDNRVRPTLMEDGSVDFFNLNIVSHCKVGDVLAELQPEVPGTPGMDVYGNPINPAAVKRLSLSYGKNIDISEDKLVLTSQVSGHVTLVDGKVFVSDVMEVNNVDNSTGNITYEGNVVVAGNVCTNFSIITKGDVEVKGVVEGAVIEAGGNIILGRGMNGMHKGRLKAGGNVIAKYLQNCEVSAGGYVESDSILHSRVQAGTEVNVLSRKGFISGGSVSATSIIRVKTLGTDMGADTVASVGVDPSMLNRMNELKEKTAEAQAQLKMMLPVLDASKKRMTEGIKLLPEQLMRIQKLAISAKEMQEQIEKNKEEMESIKELVSADINARIEISGEVYSGTTIVISGVSMVVRNTIKYCAFHKKNGSVEMIPL